MEQIELEELEGSVTVIVYQNEDNGYTIMKISVEKEVFTAVGTLPGVTVGECIVAKGAWGNHPTYGRQFKIEIFERKIPEGASAILKYLSSGTISGVGKATAKALVTEFGEEVFDVMEHRHQDLTKIKGITEKTAEKIHKSYCEQMGTRRLLTFLSTHELPMTLAPPLNRFYGDQALHVVETNPYILVGEEFGLRFDRADQLAMALGGKSDNEERLKAGILFSLQQSLRDGHTFQPKEKLLRSSSRVLGSDYPLLEKAVDKLLSQGELFEETIGEVEVVYLPVLQEAESYVAMRMLEMCDHELFPPKNIKDVIASIQKEQKIEYSPEQEEAVEMAANRQVMILTGGPGTGKTTSLKGVLALFERLELETALVAPTGRAAQRMGELCQRDASTIHRLLEIGVDPATGKMVFLKDEDNALEIDALIVDETSMVDIGLMAALLAGLPGDCRLVLVGDPDQLPSVGPGNLFGDLIASEVIPLVRLSRIFRQAEESNIVCNAHRVNQGELPDFAQSQGDFFFLPRHSSQETLDTIVDLCCRRLPENMGLSPDQIQVLSPTRKRGTGTVALNKALQDALNPPSRKKGERQFGDWLFRAGDRVMQVKNNYDIPWEDKEKKSSGLGVFNGDIGHIMKVESDLILVQFEGKEVEYTLDMLNQLEPAFAITVHKAQGSEYHAVIFAAFDGAPMLLTRGILYTGLTRAKNLFIGVGSPAVVADMARNDLEIQRYSGLQERLLQKLT